MIYDVVIIGAGVVGTAIARELSKYKLKIALLEKEEEPAFGVSKSNSGIIHPGTQNPPGSLKGRLCVLGNKLLRKIAREIGVDFKEVGELILAYSPEEVVRLSDLKREGKQLGVPRLKIVDQKWLAEHEPNLSKDVFAALYAPTAGIISPYRLTYDLQENAKANGVEVYMTAKVENIVVLKEKITGVEATFQVDTEEGMFFSKYVINAAGLYADEISAMVGVNDFKIAPRKGQEFLLDKKKEHLTNHLLFPLPTKTSKGTLVIKTSDGNPMIGPTAEDCESKEDLSTTDEGLQQVLASVQKMIPSISKDDIIAYFAGLRPVAGKDFIIRHEKDVSGFINVAGIQSPGLTAAPAIALVVVDLLKTSGLLFNRKLFFKKEREKTTHLFSLSKEETKQLIKNNSAYGDIVCRCEMVSLKEIKDSIARGANTLDGIKFRTRAQAGRCHGGFCTTRIMRILSQELNKPIKEITKRGQGSEIVKEDLSHG